MHIRMVSLTVKRRNSSREAHGEFVLKGAARRARGSSAIAAMTPKIGVITSSPLKSQRGTLSSVPDLFPNDKRTASPSNPRGGGAEH